MTDEQQAKLLKLLEAKEVARRIKEQVGMANIDGKTPEEVAKIQLVNVKARMAYDQACDAVSAAERSISGREF